MGGGSGKVTAAATPDRTMTDAAEVHQGEEHPFDVAIRMELLSMLQQGERPPIARPHSSIEELLRRVPAGEAGTKNRNNDAEASAHPGSAAEWGGGYGDSLPDQGGPKQTQSEGGKGVADTRASPTTISKVGSAR